MWFWNKFLVGLFAVLLVMDGSTILVSWNAPIRTGMMTEGMSYAYVARMPMIHSLMYSLAVLGTCLFRQPLMGGVCAILYYAIATMAITAFPGTMKLEPGNTYNDLHSSERSGIIDFTKHGYPIVYSALAVLAILGSIASNQVAKPIQSKFQWLPKLRGQNIASRN